MNDVKDIIDAQIQGYYDISGIATMEATTDYSGSNTPSFKEKRIIVIQWLRPRFPIIVVAVIWAMISMHAIWMLATIVMAAVYLDMAFLDTSIVYAVLWSGGAAVTWGLSTRYDYWNYRRRKIATLNIAVINFCIYVALIFTCISLSIVVPLVMHIPTNLDITVGMVIALARFLGVLAAAVPSAAVLYGMVRLVNTEDNRQAIMSYRIDRHWDTRRGKKYKYDWLIVRNKEDGKYVRVREEDRSLHAMADGTTGSSKTAGVFAPGSANDLDRKIKNEDILKRRLIKKV